MACSKRYSKQSTAFRVLAGFHCMAISDKEHEFLNNDGSEWYTSELAINLLLSCKSIHLPKCAVFATLAPLCSLSSEQYGKIKAL